MHFEGIAGLFARLACLRIHAVLEFAIPTCRPTLKERLMPLFARCCLVALALFCAAPARAADFFFKDGDVVVMIGDSITEQHLYSNFVEMWTVTRFPNWKLTFRNVGIGGDRSTGGNSRFARDVLVHK